MTPQKPKAPTEARRPANLPAGQRTYPAKGKTIVTHTVGALPIINRMLQRMRLKELLDKYLPPEDTRTKVATSRVILLLLKNLLISREPL